MTTQMWLEGYRFYEKMLAELEKKKREALEDSIRITAYPKDTAVQSSRLNSTEERNIKYIDKVQRISVQIEESKKYICDVQNAIATVSNMRHRMLLQLKYIEGETWEEVAEAMGMSEKWVRETLNGRAIKELEHTADKWLPAGV